MDKDLEEFQSMGIFKFYKEAYSLTLSWKKIFSQIALALTLPLAIILLSQIEISHIQLKNNTTVGFNLNTLFRAISWLVLVILSLPSTSAVVYTIACINFSKDTIAFKNVMTAVPKVWKRLMVTFLWFILIVFFKPDYVTGILLIPYSIGAIYISLVWYLASVISILEDIRGIKAVKKGKDLLKGKIWVAFITTIPLQICNMGFVYAFRSRVVNGESLAMGGRVSLGILCLVLLVIFFHFGLVIQTIIYFVCKSYHNENIDMSSLADHLDGYYEPLGRDEAGNSV
ncbi:hypothetical protein MKW98_028802 [Papaver atlanticum]|uniref:Transmembrane protein n=1 Tax=Papaver atlanticum TaxID=357466 RepID=A0AAD4SCG8_9MAGN|nr:hypothetical protein MKW98_028802 [Papaver atlanticum]